MELKAKDDVLQVIDDCEHISGFAHKMLTEAIEALPTRGVIRDCNRCFGASFNDCDKCEKYKVAEAE